MKKSVFENDSKTVEITVLNFKIFSKRETAGHLTRSALLHF